YDRRIQYDRERHFTSVEDGRGGITSYWGDGTGLVVKERKPGGLGSTEYTWNENYQKTSETDGEGNKTAWEYDERGNCVRERNALGYERRRRYDVENQVIEVVDEAGGIWKVVWNRAGKPTSIENPLGVATMYTYDERGR